MFPLHFTSLDLRKNCCKIVFSISISLLQHHFSISVSLLQHQLYYSFISKCLFFPMFLSVRAQFSAPPFPGIFGQLTKNPTLAVLRYRQHNTRVRQVSISTQTVVSDGVEGMFESLSHQCRCRWILKQSWVVYGHGAVIKRWQAHSFLMQFAAIRVIQTHIIEWTLKHSC